MDVTCIVKDCIRKRCHRGRSKKTGKISYRLQCYKHSRTNEYHERRQEYYQNSRLQGSHEYLSYKEYQQLLLRQKGKCKICGGISNGKRLSIDHDHQTGKIRGLLCDNCNFGLGWFKDNIEVLKRAISYLE